MASNEISYCESCRKPASKGGNKKHKRCGRCRVVFYCSTVCQRDHWKDHKAMCRIGLPGWIPYSEDIAAAYEVEKLWESQSTSKTVSEIAFLETRTSASTDRVNLEAESLHKKGRKSYDKGNLANAIQAYNKAIKIDPFNDKYYTSRAKCLMLVKLYPIAMKDFGMSNLLAPHNILAWRGLINTTYKLSHIEEAKKVLSSMKKAFCEFRDAGVFVKEMEESIDEFQHLLYDNFDPSNSPTATCVSDREFPLSFYMTDGLYHKHEQELIMVDVPRNNYNTIYPKGWHTDGWYELLELKTQNTRLHGKIFRNDYILSWQSDDESNIYSAVFFTVSDESQVELITRELYPESYKSDLASRSYSFVKLFLSDKEAHAFCCRYSNKYVSDVLKNASRWKECYSRGEKLVPYDKT